MDRATISMMKAWDKMLTAEMPDGTPDIDTIMKASKQISEFCGLSAGQRLKAMGMLQSIVDRGFAYKSEMEKIRRGQGDGKGLSVHITQEALNELDGIDTHD